MITRTTLSTGQLAILLDRFPAASEKIKLSLKFYLVRLLHTCCFEQMAESLSVCAEPLVVKTSEVRRVARSYNSSIIQKDMPFMKLPDATGQFPKEFPTNGVEFARLSGNSSSIVVAAHHLSKECVSFIRCQPDSAPKHLRS